jgi:hypothetical protein
MAETAIYIVGFLIISFGFVVFFGAPYVPTLKHDRSDVLKLYKLKKSDVFVDIGSGDGVLLRMAAGQKVKAAIGFELSPWMYIISRVLCRGDKRVTIHLSNFWRAQLPNDTTVVYTFLNGRYMPRLKKKLEAHVRRTNRPLYFITYGFKMPGLMPVKNQGAMSLYKFETLQT